MPIPFLHRWPAKSPGRFASLLAVMSLTSCGYPDKVELSDKEKRPALDSEKLDKYPASVTSQWRFASAFLEKISVWQKPAGWKQMPGDDIRELNFAAGPNGAVECYISRFPFSEDAVLDNMNRWRQQMGDNVASSDPTSGLSRIQLYGGEALLVDYTGDYTPAMSPALQQAGLRPTPKKDYRMLGALGRLRLSADDTEIITVKMVGPKDLVEKEKENFLGFCSSLKVNPEAGTYKPGT